jgi:hypothetical protein
VLGVVSLKPPSSTPYEVAADTALQDRVIDELVIFDVCTFAGAPGAAADAVTAAVLPDVAAVEPPAFVAVTTTSIVSPTSEDCNAYVELVAPLMLTQLEADEQSCH